MINFNMDGSPVTLWTPSASNFKSQQRWVNKRFPSKSRVASIIVEDENVLSKASFIKVLLLFTVFPSFQSFHLRNHLAILPLTLLVTKTWLGKTEDCISFSSVLNLKFHRMHTINSKINYLSKEYA